MIKDKIPKIKKYLFMISILFLFTSFWHLLYAYMYNDSKYEAIEWWNISEAIIWEFPSLNPLKSLSWNNKYVIWLLYRSLLTYDIKEKKIIWDLANCDISNLLEIECFLKDNVKWSNWEDIKIEDIVSTYNVLKNSNINPLMLSLLEKASIQEAEWKIIFKNETKDVNFLNIFFTPIIKADIINNMWEDQLNWDFSPIDQIYSWKFVINNVSQDQTVWITSIILWKNDYYDKNDIIIDNYTLKIFKDLNDFLKHKETINLINDKNSVIWESIVRLESHKYTLPQYISLFINYERIKDSNLRAFILNKIDRNNLIKILWEENNKIIQNPYLSDVSIENDEKSKNIDNIMRWLGYFTKSELAEKYVETKIEKEIISNEAKVEEKEEIKTEVEEETNEFWWKSEIIIKPDFIDKYNFISKDDLLLEWKVESDVDSVYINDYKLLWFSKWDDVFYYRVRENIWNIKEWENIYKIYFEKSGEKELKEELVFYYYKDAATLEKEKINYLRQKEENKLKKEEEKKAEISQTIKENELKLENEIVNSQMIKNIEALEEHFFYNEDLERFSLDLYYIEWDDSMEKTANYIKSVLESYSIYINLKMINLSNLKEMINLEETEDYDLILAWINLWYFDFNIYPYFHSSQVKKWYNFSNFRATFLDSLLETLKWDNLPREKILELEWKVLEILKQEQIVKTLYTPILNSLSDKKIKNYSLSDYIPEKELRRQALWNIYINEKKIINTQNKSIKGFFKFLISPRNEK